MENKPHGEPETNQSPKSQRIWISTAVVLLIAVSLLGYALYRKSTEYSQLQVELAQYEKQDSTAMKVDKINAVDISGINSDQQRTEQQEVADVFIGTGGVDFNGSGALINIIYDSGVEFTGFYVEYGEEYGELSQQTAPDSEEIGLGGDETQSISIYSAFIEEAKLKPGVRYFYQIVWVTDDGNAVKSAVSAFDNIK